MALGTSEPHVTALVGCNPMPPPVYPGAGGARKWPRYGFFLEWKAKISSFGPSARDLYHGWVCCPQPRHPQPLVPGLAGGCVGDVPHHGISLPAAAGWQQLGQLSMLPAGLSSISDDAKFPIWRRARHLRLPPAGMHPDPGVEGHLRSCSPCPGSAAAACSFLTGVLACAAFAGS